MIISGPQPGRRMGEVTGKEIQELAGHKTITMSARYAHLSPDHKLAVIDCIASTGNCQPPQQPPSKKATPCGVAFLPVKPLKSWCREGGSNPHDLAIGGF